MFRDELANGVLGSEAFLWLMCGGAHVGAHVEAGRPAWVAWRRAGGLAWGEVPGGDIFLRGKSVEGLAGPLASDGGPVRTKRSDGR